MILKTNQIPTSQLKIPFERFVESYVEQIDSSIFEKTWKNRATYSRTERPFIGFKKNDGSFYVETQYMFYLKTTGMFYFVLSMEGENLRIVSGMRQKLWFVSILFLLFIMLILLVTNLIFNNDAPTNMIITVASILFLVFAIGRPFFDWTSARLKLYRKLIKEYK